MKKHFLVITLSTFVPLPVVAQAPQIASQSADVVPQQEENALKYLQAAQGAYKTYAYTEREGRLYPPSGADAQRIVEENARVFPLLERAVALPLRFSSGGTKADVQQGQVVDSGRRMARLLELRCSVQSEAGDFAGAAHSALLCVALGMKLQEDGGLTAASTGYVVENTGMVAIERLASKWNVTTLKSTVRGLQEAQAKRPAFSVVLASDNKRSAATWRALFQTQALTVNGYDQATQERLLAALRQASERDDALFLRDFSQTRDLNFELDDEPTPNPLPVIDAKFDARAWAESWQKSMRAVKHNRLLNRTRAQTNSALLQAALAFRAYRIEHKTPPTSLQVLVPEYMAAVPSDPFDLNAPLRFKSSADGVKIYSVGPDGLDDGGLPAQNLGDDGWHLANRNIGKESRGDMLAPAALLKS